VLSDIWPIRLGCTASRSSVCGVVASCCLGMHEFVFPRPRRSTIRGRCTMVFASPCLQLQVNQCDNRLAGPDRAVDLRAHRNSHLITRSRFQLAASVGDRLVRVFLHFWSGFQLLADSTPSLATKRSRSFDSFESPGALLFGAGQRCAGRLLQLRCCNQGWVTNDPFLIGLMRGLYGLSRGAASIRSAVVFP